MKSPALLRLLLAASVCALLPDGAAPASALARLHNGLGDIYNIFGSGEGTVSPYWEAYPALANNASPLAFGSLTTLPALTSASEVSDLLRQLDQHHFPNPRPETIQREIDAYYGSNTGSRDGRHPAFRDSWEAFASARWDFSDFDRAANRPVYDAQAWGAFAGVQRWFDDERLVGVSAAYNFTRARLHDGGGHIDGENIRLRLHAALIPEGQPWWLALGVSGGHLGYTTKRFKPGIFGSVGDGTDTVRATPDGYEYGFFVAATARLRLWDNLVFTPLARLDFNRSEITRFEEHGTAEYPLRVSAFGSDSVQTRLGGGLEYSATLGPVIARAGCSVAWASELAGDDIRIRSRLVGAGDSASYTIRSGQLFGDAVEISPSVSLVFKCGLVLKAAYDLRITFDAQFSQCLSGGVGWRF